MTTARIGPLFVGGFVGPFFVEGPPGVIFGPGVAIDGIGPPGAATFAIDLQDELEVKLEWSTGVFKAQLGLERRSSNRKAAKISYGGSAHLIGDQARSVRSTLARYMAAGQTFLLALPHEALTITGDAAVNVVPVAASETALCDWLVVPGQRVVVVGPEGDVVAGVVQTGDPTSVTLDVDVSEQAVAGRMIVPVMAVLLETDQDFDRYPTDQDSEDEDVRETWSIKARAVLAGFCDRSDAGVGAALTMHASRPVWDRDVDIEGTAPESIHGMTSIIDMDGVPVSSSNGPREDWARQASIMDRELGAQFQWLKAFLAYARGRWKAWWLPSWRPDLIVVGVVASPPAKATLDLSAPLTFSGALEGLVIRAKVNGVGGNDIQLQIVRDDSFPAHGELLEIGTLVRVYFRAGVTTSTDVEALLATSTQVDVASPSVNEGDVLQADDDEVSVVHLDGGSDGGVGPTRARLDFGVMSGATELTGLVVKAKLVGAAGNLVTVTLRPGAFPDAGSISETSTTITIGYHILNTTVANVEALLATSSLVDVAAKSGSPSSNVSGVFFNAPMTGGADAVTQELIVRSGSESGDFFAWWPSKRQHVQVLTDDQAVTYAQVMSAVDNGDGTLTLALDATLPDSDVVMVSWLELCRFERDELAVRIHGGNFTFAETARVVQR